MLTVLSIIPMNSAFTWYELRNPCWEPNDLIRLERLSQLPGRRLRLSFRGAVLG